MQIHFFEKVRKQNSLSDWINLPGRTLQSLYFFLITVGTVSLNLKKSQQESDYSV